jgi:hypothetical protein
MIQIKQPEPSPLLTYLVPFAAAAFGAFFGALSAFWLGIMKQKRDESNRRHNALLATQYAFSSKWNILEGIRRNLLEPYRNDPDRHLKLWVFACSTASLTIPFKNLTFIIDSDETNLLQEIHLAEQGHILALDALEKRNTELEKFNSKDPPDRFDMATGMAFRSLPPQPVDIYLLKNTTDNLYQTVDGALPKFLELIQKIGMFVKRNFKGKKAVKFQPIETQPASKPTNNG